MGQGLYWSMGHKNARSEGPKRNKWKLRKLIPSSIRRRHPEAMESLEEAMKDAKRSGRRGIDQGEIYDWYLKAKRDHNDGIPRGLANRIKKRLFGKDGFWG